MRKGIGVLLGAAALGSLLAPLSPGVANAQASRPVSMEKSLLGVRLLQDYKVVLRKYGQPTRIHGFGQPVGLDYAVDSQGKITGGIRGVNDSGSGTNLAGGATGGGPSAAGAGAAGGSPFGGGGAFSGPGGGGNPFGGAMGGPPGFPRGGGAPGSGGPGGGFRSGGPGGGGPGGGNPFGGAMSRPPGSPGGGGAPGSGGPGGGFTGPRAASAGGPGGMAGGGIGAGGNSQEIPTFGASGGFIWVYFYPGKELANLFIFNRDQRVIAICQYGRTGGQPTRKGVQLGTPVKSLYSLYGWPDSTEPHGIGNMLAMFYNEKHHVQFDMLNNRVVGIVIALSEDTKIYRDGQGGRSGGGGGAGFAGGGPRAAGTAGAAGGGGKFSGGGGGGGGGGAASAVD